MRLLTYLPRLAAIGGVELHLLQLTRELARRGHQVDFRYTYDGELRDELESFCASVTRQPFIRYGDAHWQDLRRIVQGARSAARTQPDVLYANNFTELAWAASVKAITRVPIVCQLHEFEPWGSASMSILSRPVRRFVVASDYMRRTWAEHGLDADRIVTIPYGIDLSDYPQGSEDDRRRSREALGLPPDAYVVLYLGRIDVEKGVEVLLDAWRRLDASPQEARLLLVGSAFRGPDPAAYLEQLKRGAPPGCDWLPMRPDVLVTMHAADVLVLPSVWEEPFGRVIIEAMATGRPVVASDCGGIPEILEGPFEKFLFPRGDPDSLAEQLADLRDWRTERPALADECTSFVAERFALRQTAGRVETLFGEVAGLTG